MGCVINDTQAVFVGNFLDLLSPTGLAIHMHRHDGRSLGCDGRLDAIGINAARCWVNIHEHGFDAVPPQRMGRCHKAVGRGDNLTADVQGLQRRDQRQCAIGKHTDIRHLEVFAQGGFKSFMEFTVIGHPLAVPDLTQHLVELVKIRQQR